ncbi:MAG TPA: signal peptidase II [Firmicutes bacterium]|nr:signal peptidase II [Bacillota bacterium]
MLYFALGAVVVVLDQLTKLLVQARIPMGQSVAVFHPVLYFTHVQNPGAAFGIFPAGSFLFVMITFIVLGALGWFVYTTRPKDPLLLLGITFSASGALGNVIDRLRIGKVVDFIDIRVWPIFNVADIAIVGGVLLLLWYIVRQPKTQGERW